MIINNLNYKILHKDVQDYIEQNLNSDISKLLFKGSSFDAISIQDLVEQIEAKKRCEKKLSTWFQTKNIYYPNKLNIEQTSSEIAAKYKSELISGDSIIDLTGGFGVDCFYFSKRFKEVIHCEINKNLSKIVTHNFKQFNSEIKTIAEDGLAYLKKENQQFDWIYIDPSRRNDAKGKVFLLRDCLPNVPQNLNLLFNHSNNIIIKVSPILDISSAIKELKFVKEVQIVAIANEVKELLFILKKDHNDSITIRAVNIKKSDTIAFEAKFNSDIKASYFKSLSYLYEPNAAILKAGLFNEISNQLNIHKLHINSHLYTSNNLIKFPGRRFKIKDQLPYDRKQLKKLISSNKANITTRNFPETVAQIRKKTGIKDGGNDYLFFTTDVNNKHIVLRCKKV